MTGDRHFDDLAERFARNIYDTRKGQLRLQLLQEDLAALAAGPPLRILDAGGGLGQVSRWFAARDHRVTLCDAAAPMLERAREANRAAGLEDRIELVKAPIQAYCDGAPPPFDLILCHAVLEWVERPRVLVERLSERLKPGGRLSLMFYNRHALVLRNALRGNFRRVMRGETNADGRGLTPARGLEPDQVAHWLQQLGYRVELDAGVRCFFDYLPRRVQEEYSFEDILEIERHHRGQLPYRRMARYIHLLAARETDR